MVSIENREANTASPPKNVPAGRLHSTRHLGCIIPVVDKELFPLNAVHQLLGNLVYTPEDIRDIVEYARLR